ncbi:MAG: amidohydrolase family protein [Gemmatimonadota bacterium]|nr:amidohydrolase family protein [Gemmatimonadota bacterium]
MHNTVRRPFLCLVSLILPLLAACGDGAQVTSMQVFTGARLIDGTGAPPIENAVVIVDGGQIVAVGEAGTVELPRGIETVDLRGRTLIPGLINSHGHVGDVRGLEAGQYSRENVLDQLALSARYGITTVVSLGDDREEGVVIRDEQAAGQSLDRARLFVAGPVLNPATPEDAARLVAEDLAMNVDWVKIRIDDAMGSARKMSPEIYEAVITEAHRAGLPVAVHVITLEDAKRTVAAGADFVAHSVRDQPVDDELIALMRERRICLSPTLTRELSTFIYGTRPAFFDDPFFLRDADPAVIAQLENPDRQRRIRESASAKYWEERMPIAMKNLTRLSDEGVRIAMGTDSGVATRFQGYFEHLELELMVDAGLTPMQALVAATGDAASCMGLDASLGTIEPGKRADFVVLTSNPLDDIMNTREIESVWIEGKRIER